MSVVKILTQNTYNPSISTLGTALLALFFTFGDQQQS